MALLAEAIMPEPLPPVVRSAPPVMPTVADEARVWLLGLRWHHGPDETCNHWDCYPCWLVFHEAAE